MDTEKARLFEAIFNQIPFPITILEANVPRFTIVAMNQERKNAPGTPADAVGRDAFDVYKPWDKNSEEQVALLRGGLNKAIEEKTPVKLPLLYFEIPLPGGAEIKRAWVQNEITPILDAEGNVGHLLSMARDVTEAELNRLSLMLSQEKEQHLMEELATTNEILTATNNELVTLNEELACTNEELLSTNDELVESRNSLEALNEELEEHILSRTRSLSESEDRFRTMFETIPQMAWSVNNKAQGTFYNKSWYDYTGLDFESSKGNGWHAVIHPDDLIDGLAKFRGMQDGTSIGGGIENRFRRADGEYRWHQTRMLPIRNADGEVEMWIGTATEIHELKELQQQKDDFISIASHELKTPITALKASLQLLDRMKDNLAPGMLPKLISQSRKSIQKIGVLVDDLLNIGRLQQKDVELNKTVFTVSEMLNSVCNPLSLAGKYKFNIMGDKELQVYADEHRVDQVVTNFINNAVKYAPDSTDISLIIEQEYKKVKVSVVDYGPGIPEDKLPHLFDRYYRIDPAGYQGSGLGLGLYISSEIVKRHGGEIGVESELGLGSTFWFTLPLDG